MTTQNLVHGSDAGRWEQAIYAFLAEKERRSGSMTGSSELYGHTPECSTGSSATWVRPPDQVTSPEVFGYGPMASASQVKSLDALSPLTP